MFNNGFDFTKALIDRGLSILDAKYINYNVSGVDKIYLENCLLSDTSESDELLRGFLDQYDIDFEPKYDNISINDNGLTTHGYNIKVVTDNDKFKHFLSDKRLLSKVDGNTYYIKCPDDHTAKIIDDYVNFLNKGNLKESAMANKNKRTISDLQKKIGKVKPRDPNHQLANQLNIKNGGYFDNGNTKRKDTEGRGAKHKKSFRDRDFSLDEEKLNESRLGFSSMDNIGNGTMNSNLINFKELSRLSGINEDDISGLGLTNDTDDMDNFSDTGSSVDFDNTDTDNNFGDTDMDQAPIDVTVMPANQNSEAMSAILDNLNSIQSYLPDIKLVEYKTLLIRVEELNDQLRSMASSYVSERKLRK